MKHHWYEKPLVMIGSMAVVFMAYMAWLYLSGGAS